MTASRKSELFPYETFPIRLEDKTENKVCYFQTEGHAQKYIDRYKCVYKAYYFK